MTDDSATRRTTSTEDAVEEHGIRGEVVPGYEPVHRAFVDNFVSHGEVGASFTLYVDGRKVVDLWGGIADADSSQPYTEDTLQLVFSSTKGVTALVANLLAQRGQLDLDAPVTEYWPEFAASGKGAVPVRWLLSHKVGLPYIEAPLTLDQLLAWEPAVDALAAQEPLWEPGTAHGYHAVTYGWLVGEVIRRVTGRTVGAIVADELAGPLDLELWIGLPEEQQERVAPLTASGRRGPRTAAARPAGRGPTSLAEFIQQFLGPDALLLKALDGAPGVFTRTGIFNRPEVRAAELPAANGVTTARSLAKLYAATIGPVDGDGAGSSGPLLDPRQLAAATEQQTTGPDKVLLVETAFGQGYMLSSPYSAYGGERAFGHSGAGGSLGFADPENGIAVGYAMNRMMQSLSGDARTQGLVRAVYEARGLVPAHV